MEGADLVIATACLLGGSGGLSLAWKDDQFWGHNCTERAADAFAGGISSLFFIYGIDLLASCLISLF